jgi:uncharacterized protein (TIGR02001 family)
MRLLRLLAILAASTSPALAQADESDKPFHWSNGAAIATEYVWRGQSLTDGKPAIVGELKISHKNGLYAGIWAGSLDLGSGTDTRAEFDYFLGWNKRYGKVYVNTGYLYRQRPSDALELDFQEVSVFAAYDFGRVRAGAGSYYSGDYFQGGDSIYNYVNLRMPLGNPGGIPVMGVASAGRYDFSNRAIGDYNHWDLRVIAQQKSWEYSIGYSDTDVDPLLSGLLTRNESGARWRAQVLVMF